MNSALNLDLPLLLLNKLYFLTHTREIKRHAIATSQHSCCCPFTSAAQGTWWTIGNMEAAVHSCPRGHIKQTCNRKLACMRGLNRRENF